MSREVETGSQTVRIRHAVAVKIEVAWTNVHVLLQDVDHGLRRTEIPGADGDAFGFRIDFAEFTAAEIVTVERRVAMNPVGIGSTQNDSAAVGEDAPLNSIEIH